jgi:hypothetical protein
MENAAVASLYAGSVDFWDLAHRSQPHENPFWALIAQTNRGCAACLETEQHAVDAAQDRPATVRCFAGLCHTAVPVKLGDRTIGFLQTGQVAPELPSTAGFEANTCGAFDGFRWAVHLPAAVVARICRVPRANSR